MFSAGEDNGSSSTRSSAVSSTNGILSTRSPLQNMYHHRPGSGLSSSTVASSSGLNSTFSSAFTPDNAYNSPRRQAPILAERFRNWNDLFEHLKKEMVSVFRVWKTYVIFEILENDLRLKIVKNKHFLSMHCVFETN